MHCKPCYNHTPCIFTAEFLVQFVFHIVISLNSLRPRRNRRLFADDMFKYPYLNENVLISIKIPLKFIAGGLINNISALFQIMAWRRSGEKPLSKTMMLILLTHIYICVTWSQWVKSALFVGWICTVCARRNLMVSDLTTRDNKHCWWSLLLAKIYNFWQVCSFVGLLLAKIYILASMFVCRFVCLSVCLSVSLSVLSSITHERFDISSPNLVHIWNGWAVPVCDIDK